MAAAWLITLLATILFAAGPIYSSAASLAGLRRTLADAPAADVSVEVSLYSDPAVAANADGAIQSAMQRALSPLPAEIVRDGRDAATLGLAAVATAQKGDQAVLGFLDGLPDHAQLVQGAWPTPSGSESDPLQVVVAQEVASDLKLSLGDQLSLNEPHNGQPTAIPVRLVGIYSRNDVQDPFWYGEPQLRSGIVQNGGYRILGPFVTTPEGILANPALNSIHVQWRTYPGFGALTGDNIASIHARLDDLESGLRATVTPNADVKTALPSLLGTAERSLLVSRTEMLLIMAQLAIMAAYAIALTAALLVDHRRVETALLRSRGAGAGRLAWLSFAEGLLLVVPAVIVAPWLAVAEATVLNLIGPLAEIGLEIQPQVTADSYALAAAAGLVCLALLVLPAFLSARDFASAERERSRQETRTLGQRMGLDAVLLAISIIALWQLQLYGAPLTRTIQGTLGFDPLLVLAPTIGLLAGGILALRILPLVAASFERSVGRGREIVASLGSRQLARRPLRYTRTALLLILALSMGVFAVSYASTWADSQQDQAAYQAGADVRAVVGTTPVGRTPAPPGAYAALSGVQVAMPVERIARGIELATGVDVVVLGVDADDAASVIHVRSDDATQTLGDLMRPLSEGRPAPQLVSLPDDAAYLQVTPLIDISHIAVQHSNDFPQPPPTDLDPTTLTDVKVTAAATIRDAHGLLYKVVSQPVEVTGPGTVVNVPLAPSATLGTGRSAGPLELVGLELGLSLPTDTLTTEARVGVSSLSVGPATTGPWTALPLDGWAARFAPGTSLPKSAPGNVSDMVVHLDGTGNAFLAGGQAAGKVVYVADAINALHDPVPVVANEAFLAASATAVGDDIDVSIDGARRRVAITGAVDTFPTTDPAQPMLIVDRPTLDLLRYQSTTTTRSVDEWWMSVEPRSASSVATALRLDPFGSKEVVGTADRTRTLSTDPVALGIIGALLLGFVATGVFALVALVVSAAVSARERRTEFALLRALGLSGRQLSSWLWLENGSVVLVSLIAGTIVGVVISWIALPFITVTQQATAPVPSVLVQLPWDKILLLDLVVLIALGIAVAILAIVLRRIGVGSILRLGED